MTKWNKIQHTQITIPQNNSASIFMMAKLHLPKLKDYQKKHHINQFFSVENSYLLILEYVSFQINIGMYLE